MSCSHQKHPYVVVNFIKTMKKMGMDVPDIYAVKHDKLDKVKDNDNWTEFYAWAKTAVMKFVKSKNYTQKVADAYYYEVFDEHLRHSRAWANEVIDETNVDNRKKLSGFIVDEDSPLKKLMDASLSMLKKKNSAEKIDKVGIALHLAKKLCGLDHNFQNSHFYNSNFNSREEELKDRLKKLIKKGTDLFKVEPSYNLDDLSLKAEERYPLLKFMDDNKFSRYTWEDELTNELANYANVIDITFASKKKV